MERASGWHLSAAPRIPVPTPPFPPFGAGANISSNDGQLRSFTFQDCGHKHAPVFEPCRVGVLEGIMHLLFLPFAQTLIK